jgi:hypothetical protein
MESHQYYLEVMARLWDSVRGKRPRPELWPYKWVHHANALAHDVLRVCKFLAKKSIKIGPKFWFFQKLKNPPKG